MVVNLLFCDIIAVGGDSMEKPTDNIFILLIFPVMQIIGLVISIAILLLFPNVLENELLLIEVNAYTNLFIMLLAFGYIMYFYFTYFKKQFGLYQSNWKKYSLLSFATVVAIFASNIISAVLMDALGIDGTSVNQEALAQVAQSTIYAKISLVIFTVILAPVIEEFIFRKGVFGLLRKYDAYVSIIVSGILFGLIHVLFDPELLMVVPYLVSGFTIAAMFYIAEENIFVVIIGHSLVNIVGVTAILMPPEVYENIVETILLFI